MTILLKAIGMAIAGAAIGFAEAFDDGLYEWSTPDDDAEALALYEEDYE